MNWRDLVTPIYKSGITCSQRKNVQSIFLIRGTGKEISTKFKQTKHIESLYTCSRKEKKILIKFSLYFHFELLPSYIQTVVLSIIFIFFSMIYIEKSTSAIQGFSVKLFVSSTLSPINNAIQRSTSSTAIYISGLMI